MIQQGQAQATKKISVKKKNQTKIWKVQDGENVLGMMQQKMV